MIPPVYMVEEWCLGLSGRPLGERGERLAARYLQVLGHAIVAKSHESFMGEIDLISHDGPTLVFTEVKTRSHVAKGRPDEAVTLAKQRQMTRLAQVYLTRQGRAERPCRFDVIAIIWPRNGLPRITHFRSAFDAV